MQRWRRSRRSLTDHGHDEVSDEALLARARADDPLAFRALVERHESVVAATAIGMLGPGADAEDVGQETFVRFYRSMDRFRGDAALGTYLVRIAMNLSLNALQRRKRLAGRFLIWDQDDFSRGEAAGGLAEETPEFTDAAVAGERRRRVRAAIDALDPKHRAVVVLRMLEGYSTRETAAILGVREGTVLSRLARAKARLKEMLKPWVDDDA